MIKILSISGSPTKGGSAEILLFEIAKALESALSGHEVEITRVRLAELTFIACQACGKAPTPNFCFYDDGLTSVYTKLAECDCLLFGSPLYFDSVSAQAKAFIDRCNCLRPPDYEHRDPEHDFIKLIHRKRPGAFVLVGGQDSWYEGARRTIAGFFKWVEITNEGMIIYNRDVDFTRLGAVRDEPDFLRQAEALGKQLAQKVLESHEA